MYLGLLHFCDIPLHYLYAIRKRSSWFMGVVICLYCIFSTFLVKSGRPIISSPVDFEHTVHVGFDPITGEFTVSLISIFQYNYFKAHLHVIYHLEL